MDVTDIPNPWISRRGLLRGASGLALGVTSSGLLLACADPEQAGAIRMTTGLIAEFTPFFVAYERELFAEHGVDADLQGFIIANDGAEAQLAGEADSSTLVELPLLRYVNDGEDLVSVAVVTTARNLKLVAQEELANPEDLAGHRVAYPFGTGQDYGFAAYLEHVAVDPEEIEHVNSENADLVPLMARGDVDAVVAVEPQVSQALDGADGAHLMDPEPSEAYQTRSHLVVDRTWAEENADTVRGVLLALLDAGDVIAEEPDETAAIMGSQINLSAEDVQQLWEMNENDWSLYLDQDTLDSLDAVSVWMRETGETEEEIDVQGIIEPAYLEEIDDSAVRI